jgi:ribosomal protein L15
MKMNQLLRVAGITAGLCLSASEGLAQQGGPGGGMFNFDPAEIQQRIMDNYREQLEVKDDAEWKLIQERVQKVVDARREIGFGGMGMGMGMGMFGGRGPRGGGDNAAPEGGQRRGFGAFGPTPSPEQAALQKAIDSKASPTELKAALAKYLEARKQKQTNLEKAQAELRKVLSIRQEAIASMSGLL